MIRVAIFCSVLASLVVSALCAVAQTPEGTPAQLMRVTEGVFALTPGKSIDLTSEKILLAIPPNYKHSNGFQISINGHWAAAKIGDRIDLKSRRYTQQGDASSLSGKDNCFLDVIDFVEPRGGIPTATFRLNCL